MPGLTFSALPSHRSARPIVALLTCLGLMLSTHAAHAQSDADSGAGRSLTVPDASKALELTLRAGAVESGMTLRLTGADGTGAVLRVTASDLQNMPHHYRTRNVDADALADAGFDVRLWYGARRGAPDRRRFHFIRPDVHFYHHEDHQQAIDRWQTLPAASEQAVTLTLRRRSDGVLIFLDGRTLGRVGRGHAVRRVRLEPIGRGELRAKRVIEAGETARYVPVDLRAHPHHAGQGDPVYARAERVQQRRVSDIPMQVLPGRHSVDVALSRWLGQVRDGGSFYDPFFKRSSWDGLPERILFSVPKRYYNYAHVLCAVDPRMGEAPRMAVKLGLHPQVWNGGGPTYASTNVTVDPDQPRGIRSIERVGEITLPGPGETRALPLYMIEVPLPTGRIIDVLNHDRFYRRRADYLYLEFSRTLHERVTTNNALFQRKPVGPRSQVRVLGVTLEKAPVQLDLADNAPGFAFYRQQDPKFDLTLRNKGDETQRITLEQTFTPLDGDAQERSARLTVAPGETQRRVSLDALPLGWMQAQFVLRETDSLRPVWRQPVNLALLPPDTRQATHENSPYCTWWFQGNHYTAEDALDVLPLYQKLGFRLMTPPDPSEKHNRTPNVLREHGVYPAMAKWFKARKKEQTIEGQVTDFFETWPEVEYAMLFHERGFKGLGVGIPNEFLGKAPPQLEGDQLEVQKKRVAQAKQYATTIHKNTDAKVLLGNSWLNSNVHWMRIGFPKEHVDAIGLEQAIQTIRPEAQPNGANLQGNWLAFRMAEIYGYDEIDIMSCYEYDYRSTAPGALTPTRQAAWYSRDVLHNLAYGMKRICVALIGDCNSAYYSSRWGATGLTQRAPYMQPKPSFVALTTLTRVLDRATFRRRMDLDSTGVYCLEFELPDGFAYAMWCTSGERSLNVRLADGASTARVIDSMGQRHAIARGDDDADTVAVETMPRYVVTSRRLASVELEPARPERIALDKVTTDISMKQADQWQLLSEPDAAFADYCAYKPMTRGDIELSQGDGALRLTLNEQPDVPGIVGRYAILAPKGGPIALSGEPDTIAASVRGNSNWGRVYFELIDANGRRWLSNGWSEGEGTAWDMSDWRAETSIHFDGWRSVALPLPGHYPSGYYKPSFRHWRCRSDNSKTTKLAYPVKLNRLYIVMRDQLVYLTEMVPAESRSIALRRIAAGQ